MTGKLLRKRRIETDAYEYGESSLLVVGRLIDDIIADAKLDKYTQGGGSLHDLRVEMEVSLPELTITAIRADMLTVPYEACHEIASSVKKLIGVNIAKGFSKAVLTRLSGPKGCVHLTSLILAMPTPALHAGLIRQNAKAASSDAAMPDDSFLLNTCYVWREGGPQATSHWKNHEKDFLPPSERSLSADD